jgi:hypothetical protein
VVDGARLVTRTIWFQGPDGPRLVAPPPHVHPHLHAKQAQRRFDAQLGAHKNNVFGPRRVRLGVLEGPINGAGTLVYATLFPVTNQCLQFKVTYCLEWTLTSPKTGQGGELEQPLTQ